VGVGSDNNAGKNNQDLSDISEALWNSNIENQQNQRQSKPNLSLMQQITLTFKSGAGRQRAVSGKQNLSGEYGMRNANNSRFKSSLGIANQVPNDYRQMQRPVSSGPGSDLNYLDQMRLIQQNFG